MRAATVPQHTVTFSLDTAKEFDIGAVQAVQKTDRAEVLREPEREKSKRKQEESARRMMVVVRLRTRHKWKVIAAVRYRCLQ